jgi:hypothetical protein
LRVSLMPTIADIELKEIIKNSESIAIKSHDDAHSGEVVGLGAGYGSAQKLAWTQFMHSLRGAPSYFVQLSVRHRVQK